MYGFSKILVWICQLTKKKWTTSMKCKVVFIHRWECTNSVGFGISLVFRKSPKDERATKSDAYFTTTTPLQRYVARSWATPSKEEQPKIRAEMELRRRGEKIQFHVPTQRTPAFLWRVRESGEIFVSLIFEPCNVKGLCLESSLKTDKLYYSSLHYNDVLYV